METLHKIEQQEIAPTNVSAVAMEMAVGMGDFSRLTAPDRLGYIAKLCALVGLNPLTKPIDIINISGKVVLYANKSCAEQLRAIHKITVKILDREFREDCYIVRASVKTPDGREDESLGVVPCAKNATGDVRANAMMKAETKAKRRATLSLVGLGFIPDETELDTMRQAKVDSVTTAETDNDRGSELLRLSEASSPATTAQDTPPEKTLPVVAEVISAGTKAPEILSQGASALDRGCDKPVGQPEPPPAQAPAGSDFLNADGSLTDAGVVEVERKLSVRGEEDAYAAIAYLSHKGQLGKGQPLSSLSKTAAAYLLNNIVGFWKAVDGFKSAQAKGGAK